MKPFDAEISVIINRKSAAPDDATFCRLDTQFSAMYGPGKHFTIGVARVHHYRKPYQKKGAEIIELIPGSVSINTDMLKEYLVGTSGRKTYAKK